MAIAIILGVVSGALGALPLFAGLRWVRKQIIVDEKAAKAGYMGKMLLFVVASIAILFGTLVICINVARAFLLPFAIAEGLALIAVVLGVGIPMLVRK